MSLTFWVVRVVLTLAVAHRPNEWIPPGDLTTAIDLTEALVRGYTTA